MSLFLTRDSWGRAHAGEFPVGRGDLAMATSNPMEGITAGKSGPCGSWCTTAARPGGFWCEVRPLARAWVLTCARCKSHRRFDAGAVAALQNRAPFAVCCGEQMAPRPVKGTKTSEACGPRCRASKGHVCDCSCGGENHGRDA